MGYFDGGVYDGYKTADGRSPYGLYNMSGNVREWVNDWYQWDYYASSPSDNPQGSEDTSHGKGLRGGFYGSFSSDHLWLRTTDRGTLYADESNFSVGFRCARDECTDEGACLGSGQCPPFACHGHGACNEVDGSCVCDNEHMTEDCAKCESGYTGYPDCMPPSIWTDSSSGLTWQNPPPDAPMMWADAKTYCNNLDFDGHDDWRLPNVTEMRTLVRGCAATTTSGSCNVDMVACSTHSCRNASCDGCANLLGPANGCYWPADMKGACSWYWSSSEFFSPASRAWTVQFDRASVDYLFTDHASLVTRCVRGEL